MTTPTFLVIGAQRSGSTTLHYSLARHPQIFMSRVKETNFFLRDQGGAMPGWVDAETNRRTPRTWQEYVALFAAAGPQHRAIGESSPSYLYAPVARRIAGALPHARLIVILRHPVDQARSILGTWLGRRPSLVELCDRLESAEPGPHGELPLAEHGRYAEHLAPYYERFRHILVLRFGVLQRAPDSVLGAAQDFIGVDCLRLPHLHLNSSGSPRSALIKRALGAKRIARAVLPARWLRRLTGAAHRVQSLNTMIETGVPADLRETLTERYYAADIRQLERLTGLDFGSWRGEGSGWRAMGLETVRRLA